jgi:uncharacterized protein YggE
MKNSRLLSSSAALLCAALLMAGCAALPARNKAPNVIVGTEPAGALKAAASSDTDTPSGGISVSGSGEVSVKPDVATFTVGVETTDADAAKARAANDAAMQKVLDALKAQGVAQDDLQTNSYNIYPRYDDKGTKITGYTVNNQVDVKVRNLDKLGDTLGAAGSAGANTAGAIRFDISDRTAAYNQALEQAMAKAQARAKVIAEACGVKLGKATVINETSTYSGPVVRGESLTGAVKDASVPVSGGELQVSASVSVSFSIGE